MMPRVILFCAALGACGLPLAADTLTLAALPALVLRHDPQAAISEQSLQMALHTYRGSIAQTLPQIDLSTSYALGFTPSQESQSTTFLLTPPFVQTVDESFTDQGNHSLNTKLSLSQLLPTAGSLFLSLENTMTVSTIGSQTIDGAQSNPETQYAQRPKLSLGITQPLFLNGKLMDFDLFPATLRKAELGYQEQDLATRAQRNLSVAQAVQAYLSVVQLRASVAQAKKGVAVSRGNVAKAEQNYALGLMAEADLLDARIGLAQQEQSLLELSSTLAKAERNLAHLVGREDLQGVELDRTVPTIDLTATADQIKSRALANYPLLAQKGLVAEERRVDEILGGQRSASTLSLTFSYAPRYPFSTSVPYMTDFGGSFSDLFGDKSGQDYSLTAGLTIHLFDGGKAAEDRAAAQAVAAAADESALSQREAIKDQVDLDLLQKASLEEKVALLRQSLSLAQRRLATEQSLLSLGRSTDLSVAARDADVDARANDLWRAQADLLLTVLDLRSLTGEDLAPILEGTLP